MNHNGSQSEVSYRKEPGPVQVPRGRRRNPRVPLPEPDLGYFTEQGDHLPIGPVIPLVNEPRPEDDMSSSSTGDDVKLRRATRSERRLLNVFYVWDSAAESVLNVAGGAGE